MRTFAKAVFASARLGSSCKAFKAASLALDKRLSEVGSLAKIVPAHAHIE